MEPGSLGQAHGGGHELGGYNMSEADAEKIRQAPTGDHKRSSLVQALRRTIFKAPTMLLRSETDETVMDEIPEGASPEGTSTWGGSLLLLLALVGLPAGGAYLWLQKRARLEAERAAAAAASGSKAGVLRAIIFVVALAALYFMARGAFKADEDDDDKPKWKRRHTHARAKGTTPRLRRHGTDYHE